jgi:hypothetical protein
MTIALAGFEIALFTIDNHLVVHFIEIRNKRGNFGYLSIDEYLKRSCIVNIGNHVVSTAKDSVEIPQEGTPCGGKRLEPHVGRVYIGNNVTAGFVCTLDHVGFLDNNFTP